MPLPSAFTCGQENQYPFCRKAGGPQGHSGQDLIPKPFKSLVGHYPGYAVLCVVYFCGSYQGLIPPLLSMCFARGIEKINRKPQTGWLVSIHVSRIQVWCVSATETHLVVIFSALVNQYKYPSASFHVSGLLLHSGWKISLCYCFWPYSASSVFWLMVVKLFLWTCDSVEYCLSVPYEIVTNTQLVFVH
jgi:hypothetical protein